MLIIVHVLSDLTWLPLLGGGRGSWYIINRLQLSLLTGGSGRPPFWFSGGRDPPVWFSGARGPPRLRGWGCRSCGWWWSSCGWGWSRCGWGPPVPHWRSGGSLRWKCDRLHLLSSEDCGCRPPRLVSYGGWMSGKWRVGGIKRADGLIWMRLLFTAIRAVSCLSVINVRNLLPASVWEIILFIFFLQGLNWTCESVIENWPAHDVTSIQQVIFSSIKKSLWFSICKVGFIN